MENTFANAAKEAARIMERSALRTYRITYTNGKFLTLWNGESPEHALALCAQYYHIARKRLVAKVEE